MAYQAGHKLLRQLCTVLGIDPDSVPVTKIVIECGIRDVVRATVHTLVKKDAAAAILDTLRDARADESITVNVVEESPHQP